jgi:hypothetical protein
MGTPFGVSYNVPAGKGSGRAAKIFVNRLRTAIAVRGSAYVTTSLLVNKKVPVPPVGNKDRKYITCGTTLLAAGAATHSGADTPPAR